MWHHPKDHIYFRQCTLCTLLAHLYMKVYFTASTAEFNTYKKHYFAIREYIVQQGHTLTRDWLAPTEEIIDRKDLSQSDIHSIYQQCIHSLREADIVIIEDTVSNFSTGHQITLALQYKIPTLVLWSRNKHESFNNMFIHGVESDILETAQYTESTFPAIISSFIKRYTNSHDKKRFHLVLSPMERNYLDWAQFQKQKSRTTLIRESLRSTIEEDDGYRKYLENG